MRQPCIDRYECSHRPIRTFTTTDTSVHNDRCEILLFNETHRTPTSLKNNQETPIDGVMQGASNFILTYLAAEGVK